MQLSSKTHYAVNAMMDLAIRQRLGQVTTNDLSGSQGISVSYVEQILARLRRAGLVEATRGAAGGYRLARPAGTITIAEIVSSVEAPPPELARGRDEDEVLSRQLWRELSRQIHDFLAGITLAHFVERPDIQHFIWSEQVARQRRQSSLPMRH